MPGTSSKATRSVPFFNYPKAFEPHTEAFVEIFRDVIRRGAFILQADLERFEQHLAEYLGVKHAIGLANGTDAIMIGLRAAGVGRGDEVIFPAHTMVATAAAIHFADATPVPADCGPDHLLDAASVRAALTPRTRAIVPVQVNGRTADMPSLMAIAKERDLVVVEDAAQGLGSRFDGRFAGTWGIAGTFSFYPAKILGSLGDGGALVTNDDGVARATKQFRDHGRDPVTGQVASWGMNSRLDNLQAAFLDHQFKDYQAIIDRRRAIASQYQEFLGDLDELSLPAAPDADPRHYDTYQNYELEADRRDDLVKHLKASGVGTLVQWGGKAVHQFEALGLRASLPNTERFFRRCVMLPMNLTLTDDDVAYVADRVRAFYVGG